MSRYRGSNYVGVSGLVSPEQQTELSVHYEEVFEDMDAPLLALGVKAVHKTQWDDVANKYGGAWYPVGEEQFAGALEFVSEGARHAANYNIAQVYFDPKELIADPQYATNFVRRIKQRGQNWLHVIQFDMLPYPDAPEALSYIIHEAKRDVGLNEYEVIVQCHEPAMSEGPTMAVEKLKRLSPNEIDHVLFDASHGKGKEMDADQLKWFLEAAYSDTDLDGVGFGIAGGLDAATVERHLPSVLRDFPDISWDAEGKLHQTSDGSLNMEAAKAYLSVSAEVLKTV